jgi:dihydroorotate dehydrogenase
MPARQELAFLSPWLNAAGFCGFNPGNGWTLEEQQGMFFTNPVTMKGRPFTTTAKLNDVPGGFLFDAGCPNPGLIKLLKASAAGWRASKIPVCVHIISDDPEQAGQMARLIEEYECAAAIEVECRAACPPEDMPAFWKAAAGELPLIAHRPLGIYGLDLAREMASAGVEAVSLGAPFGMARDETGQMFTGKLYGPTVLPQMLAAITRWKKSGLVVIAGGGFFRKLDALAALAAGATAVQLDAVLWRPGGWVESNGISTAI